MNRFISIDSFVYFSILCTCIKAVLISDSSLDPILSTKSENCKGPLLLQLLLYNMFYYLRYNLDISRSTSIVSLKKSDSFNKGHSLL